MPNRSLNFLQKIIIILVLVQPHISSQTLRERAGRGVQATQQGLKKTGQALKSKVTELEEQGPLREHRQALGRTIKKKEEALRSKFPALQSGLGLIDKNYIAARYNKLKATQDARTPIALQAPEIKYHELMWVAAHNSYSSHLPLSGSLNNQFNYYYAQQGFSLEQLLNVGVRMLDLDVYQDTAGLYKKNEIYLSHGSLKVDRLLRAKLRTAPRTFKSALLSITQFLEENPYEIATISLENYVESRELDKAIRSIPGIRDLILKPQDWSPTEENGWPSLGWMVTNNKRLIIFNDKGKTPLTHGLWHNVAATGFGTLDVNYLVNNLRSAPKKNQTFYLFAGILVITAPVPVPPKGTFLEQSRYVLTHLHETLENVNFEYTNSALLSRFITKLKNKYGRIPTMLYLDHIEQGDPISIAYRINQKSIKDRSFRKTWFGPFPYVRGQ